MPSKSLTSYLQGQGRRVSQPLRMNPDSSIWASLAIGLPTDATLLKATTELQYEDKEVADEKTGILVRHISFIDSSKTGKPMNLTDGVLSGAYYLPKDANVVFMGEVINSSKDVKRVLVVTDVEYVPGHLESKDSEEKQIVVPADSTDDTTAVPSDWDEVSNSSDSGTDSDTGSDTDSETETDENHTTTILTPVAGGPNAVQKPLNGGFPMFDASYVNSEAAL
jgi:hypothetical protein